MYCSGCGTELSSDLNYCNRCGNRVAEGESNSVADNLSGAVGYVGGFGLLGFIFAVLAMAKTGVAVVALVLISFLYLTALSVICFLMIRQAAALSTKRSGGDRPDDQTAQPQYLRPRTTAQLPESGEQPASVTEHTTRTLDKVPVTR